MFVVQHHSFQTSSDGNNNRCILHTPSRWKTLTEAVEHAKSALVKIEADYFDANPNLEDDDRCILHRRRETVYIIKEGRTLQSWGLDNRGYPKLLST